MPISKAVGRSSRLGFLRGAGHVSASARSFCLSCGAQLRGSPQCAPPRAQGSGKKSRRSDFPRCAIFASAGTLPRLPGRRAAHCRAHPLIKLAAAGGDGPRDGRVARAVNDPPAFLLGAAARPESDLDTSALGGGSCPHRGERVQQWPTADRHLATRDGGQGSRLSRLRRAVPSRQRRAAGCPFRPRAVHRCPCVLIIYRPCGHTRVIKSPWLRRGGPTETR